MIKAPKEIIPLIGICILALAIAIRAGMGKNNEIFDGVVVQWKTLYVFYPDAKGCEVRGSPYAIVPNRNFYEIVKTNLPVDNLEGITRGAWRVKLRGSLSRVGRYGYEDRYWREITPFHVMDAKSLDCKNDPPAMP